MRRFLALTTLLAVAFPAASAATSRGSGDGTLSVRDARGEITISAKGGVIGSFVQGRVTITDPVDGDGTGPIVTGDDWSKERSDTTTTWGGKGVRFRLIGGTYKLKVKGRGINLSAVGKGTVTITGAGTLDDGTYSVNGDDYVSVPDTPFTFSLAAPTSS